ncbi:YkgJ family cysteine cluster protein [Sulfurospirillum sp. T05]|uniref:YkgJ family cysteine cluster protein n=1 Tax=Sulfurospirillum tamanense TaxID=2813362 RepID=A0ABS2WSP0_9BACT|nr:YkgJ family cysteine cluster protein [Sulfurospirillum tamanensis]MBN2964618.1 YkgJ family cysteine cluster protein [Sulfurospirillum tamanensis]
MLKTQEGFDYGFNPKVCFTCKGNCCIGESGYIWVNPKEITAIANFLNLEESLFVERYLFKESHMYSIKEIPHESGVACLFFDDQKRGCSIYEVRPSQCRTFPFWNYFKRHFDELEKECPGIVSLSH